MKYISSILTMFFLCLVSCNNMEEITGNGKHNDKVCIFTEFSDKIAETRAVSIPSTHQLRCIIEVWTKGNNQTLSFRKEVAVEAGTLPQFEFSLPNGDYECLMWADCIEKGAETVRVETSNGLTYEHFPDIFYQTDNLHQITIKDKTAQNLFDTDLCDAFFAAVDLKKGSGNLSETLKLKRPFAKLTVKENEQNKLRQLQKMKVVYTIPAGFNVSVGEPLSNTLKAEYEKNFENYDLEGEGVLFTNYIFSSSGTEYLAKMNLVFTTSVELRYEVKEGIIPIRRNEQICASGNLIASGVIKPDEPIGDPHIGDYFFIDGTWSSSLTDDNKENCIGIVFEVANQNGDEISAYRETENKEILGYVMALKDFENKTMFLYDNTATRIVKPEIVEEEELEKFNGYSNTDFLLSSEYYIDNPSLYPLLFNFENWKRSNPCPVKNSSDWYIPSFNQLVKMIGYCYGYNNRKTNGDEGIYYKKIISQNPILANALNNAIAKGIAENIVWEMRERPIVCSTMLNSEQKQLTVRYNPSSSSAYANKENPQGLMRPIFTILK